MKPGPRNGFRWTRDSIGYAIDLWHRRHLCTPTMSDWRHAGIDHPTAQTVTAVFGSWNAAIAAAGYRPRRQGEARRARVRPSPCPEPTPRWTDAAIVDSLIAWSQAHGRPPRLSEWRLATPSTPTASTVRRYFGTWRNALAAAGLTVHETASASAPR